MVFVSMDRSAALALRAGQARASDWVAHAATPSLMRAHEYGAGEVEEAEFAALTYASVCSVIVGHDDRRLVVAADISRADVTDQGDPYGTVSVRRLAWADVRALFGDEDSSRADVVAARAAAAGQELPDAFALPAMEALIDEHDLLWYAPDELDLLL